MRNLVIFIVKQHVILLFLLLQIVCISLIVSFNEPQKSHFISSSNEIFARVFSVNQAISQYFNLASVNEDLAQENARLLQNQSFSKIDTTVIHKTVHDTISLVQYEYTVARVINNSIHRTHNYLTLNRGRKHGIEPNMAVISSTGIVGVVTNVSDNFSTVMSVLHAQYKVSAKFKNTNYFGSLYWNGKDYIIATLAEIPFHVKFAIGDTLLTNEFSNIYPPNIMIGTVKSFNKTDYDNFYSIQVQLSTEFKNLEYVYVVKNLYKQEREKLEALQK